MQLTMASRMSVNERHLHATLASSIMEEFRKDKSQGQAWDICVVFYYVYMRQLSMRSCNTLLSFCCLFIL